MVVRDVASVPHDEVDVDLWIHLAGQRSSMSLYSMQHGDDACGECFLTDLSQYGRVCAYKADQLTRLGVVVGKNSISERSYIDVGKRSSKRESRRRMHSSRVGLWSVS